MTVILVSHTPAALLHIVFKLLPRDDHTERLEGAAPVDR
jgi:hypothetical protein